MPTNAFNEAETYLLQNWEQACKVGKSMKEIQNKYAKIAEGLLDSIRDRYEGLDRCENTIKRYGGIYIGRERWQRNGNYAYIGVEHIDIDSMTSKTIADDDNPFIGVYAGTPKKPAMDIKQIERVLSAADELLTKDELESVEEDDPHKLEYEYQLWRDLPESSQLLQMLVEADGQQFVDCLTGHFEVFAKFIPVLDEVFSEEPKK